MLHYTYKPHTSPEYSLVGASWEDLNIGGFSRMGYIERDMERKRRSLRWLALSIGRRARPCSSGNCARGWFVRVLAARVVMGIVTSATPASYHTSPRWMSIALSCCLSVSWPTSWWCMTGPEDLLHSFYSTQWLVQNEWLDVAQPMELDCIMSSSTCIL